MKEPQKPSAQNFKRTRAPLSSPIGRPDTTSTLTEFARAAVENLHLHWVKKRLFERIDQGDGHAVLCIPGFVTGDFSTKHLRKNLEQLGYTSYGWEAGMNWGPSNKRLDDLHKHFLDVTKKHQGKVSIIGWSLGGVYARELARAHPELTRCVITLGAPFGAGEHPESIDPVLKKIFHILNPESRFLTDLELQKQAIMPPPVPTTSIYSQDDGVVNWKTSLNPDVELSENIDITPSNPIPDLGASHVGLVNNPASVIAIADRLLESAPEKKSWERFDPSKYSDICAGFHTSPGHEQFTPCVDQQLNEKRHQRIIEPLFKPKR
jgi:hypothetical protein